MITYGSLPLIDNDLFRRLVRARDYIHEHSHERIVLEDIAKQAHLSPFHFHRLFQNLFGKTPHAYLTEVRLTRARDLLRLDHHSITDICFDVGFNSLGSFSSLFSKKVGCSPKIYRRNMHRIIQVPGSWARFNIPGCFWVRTRTSSTLGFGGSMMSFSP